MKVTTDACLFGAWAAKEISRQFCSGRPDSRATSILDIGAGTGLLSLMLAQQCDADIDAMEIDKGAFEQAADNVAHSPWQERIRVLHGDARGFPFQQQYDTIVSNPPFYENELRSGNEKRNIAHHGNALTLNNLFSITSSRLTARGRFYFLFPFKRNKEVEKSLAVHSLFIHETVLIRQSTRHDYFRVIISGGLQEMAEIKTTEIPVWDDRQQYTPAFSELLRDYYLYL